MSIDKSAFIIRRKHYPQVAGYAQWCADSANNLAKSPPPTLDAALEVIKHDMGEYQRLLTTKEQGRPLSFGADRAADTAHHMFMAFAQYEDYASQTISRFVTPEHFPAPKPVAMQWKDGTALGSVTLAATRHDWAGQEVGPIEFTYSIDGLAQPTSKRIKSLAEAAYLGAFDTSATVEARRDACIELYYLLSELTPFKRGSSTAARLLLAAGFEATGLKLPPEKEGVDLNLEALTQFYEDFKRGFDAGKFHDREPMASVAHEIWLTKERERAASRTLTPEESTYFIDTIKRIAAGDPLTMTTPLRLAARNALLGTPEQSPSLFLGETADGTPFVTGENLRAYVNDICQKPQMTTDDFLVGDVPALITTRGLLSSSLPHTTHAPEKDYQWRNLVNAPHSNSIMR